MNSRKPIPFRYPGGKYYALDLLKPFWNSIEHDEYREPLVGGGAVFFNKNKVRFNWINDIDQELMTTYAIMSNPEERRKLLNKLKNESATKERWREVFEFKPSSDLERAYKYFYLNRTSFSGKLISPAWGYRPKRSLPPERWGERIVPCGELLEDVKITCLDFEEVITSPKAGNSVLLYLDPPYYAPPIRKHYRNGFTHQDHVRLANVLKKTDFKFFLTYDDVEDVRALYNWANITEIKFFYRVSDSSINANKRNLGFELIISNFTLPIQQTLF